MTSHRDFHVVAEKMAAVMDDSQVVDWADRRNILRSERERARKDLIAEAAEFEMDEDDARRHVMNNVSAVTVKRCRRALRIEIERTLFANIYQDVTA